MDECENNTIFTVLSFLSPLSYCNLKPLVNQALHDRFKASLQQNRPCHREMWLLESLDRTWAQPSFTWSYLIWHLGVFPWEEWICFRAWNEAKCSQKQKYRKCFHSGNDLSKSNRHPSLGLLGRYSMTYSERNLCFYLTYSWILCLYFSFAFTFSLSITVIFPVCFPFRNPTIYLRGEGMNKS